MTVLLLIRHAVTDLVDRVLSGWMPDVHLNAAGRAQAERLAERLASVPITAIYSSPLDRACETAAPLAERLGLPVQICEGLGEIHFGEWTGQHLTELTGREEWQQFNALRSTTRVPGGELMLEAQARAMIELDRLCAQHPNAVIAVISHGDVIKSAIAHYAGIHLDLFQRIEISPASLSIVAVNKSYPRILRLNDTGELSNL